MGSLSDTQGIVRDKDLAGGSADRIHLILKELEVQLIFDTQGIKMETLSLFDTQRTGDAIDIQYCLTEGKRLDDGQINL